jgi:two-component system nitrogen regulation response regulator NtrX
MKPRVLVIDDEAAIRDSLKMILEYEGYEVLTAATGEEGIAQAEREAPDLVFLDVKMPGMDGLEVLQRLRHLVEVMPIVVVSGHGTVSTAVEATKLGAFDFIEKPLERERVLVTVRNAVDSRRLRSENRSFRRDAEKRYQIVGDSGQLTRVREAIAKAAPTNATVLIWGESGVGKELVAHAIHARSTRSHRPMVAMNCAGLPETLLESELFGHVRGAFTGAVFTKKGRFALADGGTIFLDEIGTLSVAVQAKLLRVLQDREFEPLGAERTQRVNVRVIAATNRDLRQLVADGRFQEDLYYRLNVIPIAIPPLRERREDIRLLVEHFLRRFAERTGKPIDGIDEGVLDELERYDWPGNVRELENTIERAVVLTKGPRLAREAVWMMGVATTPAAGLPSMRLHQNLEWTERETIRRALDQAGGIKKDAAELMGISQRALSHYLQKHRLDS